MAKYICTYCGWKSDNLNDKSNCRHSPFKEHEYTNNTGKTQFTCTYCGNQSSSPSYGGNCYKSPHKTHKWI